MKNEEVMTFTIEVVSGLEHDNYGRIPTRARLIAHSGDAQDQADAIRRLYSVVLECGVNDEFKQAPYYAEGDERAPFFSEAYLYNLLGKEDARTVLAIVGNVLRAFGWSPARIMDMMAETENK